jgi:hypothetical protein
MQRMFRWFLVQLPKDCSKIYPFDANLQDDFFKEKHFLLQVLNNNVTFVGQQKL